MSNHKTWRQLAATLALSLGVLSTSALALSAPKFAYVANSASNTVSVYTINPTTGALTAGTTVVAGSYPVSVTVDPTGRFAYVANNVSHNVSVYMINQTSGALTAGTVVAAGSAPHLVTVDPSGRFAYVANITSNNVSVYTINPTSGALTAGTAVAAGTYPRSVAVSPSGKFAYVANQNSNNVSVYTINQTTGALTAGTTAAAGSGPLSVTVAPSGKFVYVANWGSGTVSVYVIDQTTGALTAGTTVAAGSNPASVTVDPSGKFAYVANYGSNTVSVYTIDQTSGALTAGTAVAAGIGPYSVTVDPSGKFSYVANYGSSTVSIYTINQTSGALTAGTAVAAGTGPLSVTTTAGYPGTQSLSVSLTGLTLSCPSTIPAGTTDSCTATATYSNGGSGTVTPTTWTSSDTAALSVTGGTLTAGNLTQDTLVTVSARYSEGDVVQNASAVITIKAAAASLTGLTLSCPSTLTAGTSGTCSPTASYSDGTSKAVTPASWSSSDSSTLAVSSGTLSAGNVSRDTPVTLSASYSEGGVSKTATATVTVKTASAKLTGLTISGDSSVKSGASITLIAKGGYSDNTSQAVTATWTSSDTTTATVSTTGVVTAKTVTTDTPVTITASHTENGVTQTATWMVSVKTGAAALTNLTIGGSASIDAGKTATYTASAVYGDGSIKTASNVIWTSSGAGATIDDKGVLTTDARLTADASVTLTAIYTENGVTKTAQLAVTIKIGGSASACSGSGTNLSAITVVGNAIKQPGDSLEVDYCLKNYNSATRFDVYLAVQLPDGTLLFLQSAGFFGTPTFTASVLPYLGNTLIPDKSGVVLQIPVLPMELPTGTYNFYAIPVYAGKDVMNGFNWVGTLAAGKLNFLR